MATLDSLSPDYRTQYESSLPEIKRAARAASQARGMFYSGDAIDSETKAEEDLLAKLSAQSAGAQVTQSENAKNRELEQKLADQQTAAAKRAQILGMIGTGFGAAGTLGGLAMMHPSGGNNIVNAGGKLFSVDGSGKATEIALPGQGQVGGSQLATSPSTLPGSGIGGLDAIGGQSSVPFVPGAGPGMAAPMATAVPAAATAQPPMWQNASAGGAVGAAGLGAGGGIIGNILANQVNGGKSSTASSIGAGLGGLAGGLTGYGVGLANNSPWLGAGLAGLGALGGSFGGGLIGNLFK